MPEPVPTHCFTDGGVGFVNPSPHCGTWAFCHVLDDKIVHQASGVVLPNQDGYGDTVSNNTSELLAIVRCVAALPERWEGVLYGDSLNSLNRFRGKGTPKGVPKLLWQEMLFQRSRHPELKMVLLGGHPTRADLERGVRGDGKLVSPWNVAMDKECCRLAEEFFAANGGRPVWKAKG